MRTLALACCFMLAGVAVAQDFSGRLFTDAKQRAAIDAARFGVALPQTEATQTTHTPTRRLTTPSMHFNGMVARDNQKNTVWINGKAIRTEQAAGWRYGELTRDGLRIEVEQGKKGLLKPGQRFDPSSGISDPARSGRSTQTSDHE